MKYRSWTPALLPAVVRFWNRSFSGRRNFFAMTPEVFLERVVEKETAVEAFDPKGFIAACEGDELAGFIHVGVRSESVCRALEPAWPGGDQGYVAFLFVEPAFRKRGIGTELWHRGLAALRSTRQVVLDGQCVNPFYGNSEGPFTPFWGTPEGVGVEWDDSAAKKFLARKGFAPRFKGVQLALDLGAASVAPFEAAAKAAARQGFELGVSEGVFPEPGRAAGSCRAMPGGLRFEAVAAVKEGRTAGVLAYFPLLEVRPGLFAIYEAAVVEELRGKALGKRLLEGALARMKGQGATQVEVLTLPELSPAAHKLYLSAGFKPAANWAVY